MGVPKSFCAESQFHQVCSGTSHQFSKPRPDVYRMTVGGLEVVCVALMLSGMPRLSLLANEVLLVLMCGALYTHFSVGDGVAEMGGAFVALGLVLTRLFTTGPFQATKKLKV